MNKEIETTQINYTETVGVNGFITEKLLDEIFSRAEKCDIYPDILITTIELNDVIYDYFTYNTDKLDRDTTELLFNFKVSQFMKRYNRMPTDYEMLRMNIDIIFNYNEIKKHCFDNLVMRI